MWNVSDRFLESLGNPHRIKTVATVTPPGGESTTLSLKAGRITADASARIRRKGSLEVVGDSTVFDLLTTDGAQVVVTHGVSFGADSELVPVFCGEIVDGSQQLGDGSMSFNIVDDMQWIGRANYLTPYSPTITLTRQEVIAATVIAGKPGTSVSETATDTSLVGTAVWSESRSDAINDLATAGNMDAFFLPDGSFLIRDKITLTSPAVWTVRAGSGGVLSSASRARPKDRLTNTVIVRPSSGDGSQTWAPQTAQISDTSSPRHPSKIGVVPHFFSSPTITTADAALSVATRMLDRFQGSTEALDLGLVSNPALDVGDVVRVITPQINEQPALTFQHFIDTLTLDLVTGSMNLTTRSQVATNG